MINKYRRLAKAKITKCSLSNISVANPVNELIVSNLTA